MVNLLEAQKSRLANMSGTWDLEPHVNQPLMDS